MRIFSYLSALTVIILLISCDNDDVNVPLNPETNRSFSGSFKTIDSENLTGTVTLEISDGYYSCATSLPYGHGAGKLEISKSTINFIDTLFFPIPAIYGPSYILSGEHNFRFHGDNLTLWKAKNVGEIEYELTVVE